MGRGSGNHFLHDCPLRRTGRTSVKAPSVAFPKRVALPALSASSEQRTSGPFGRRVPPVNQQSGQGGTRLGVGRGSSIQPDYQRNKIFRR